LQYSTARNYCYNVTCTLAQRAYTKKQYACCTICHSSQVWMKFDIRTDDHEGLRAASSCNSKNVLPVYCLDFSQLTFLLHTPAGPEGGCLDLLVVLSCIKLEVLLMPSLVRSFTVLRASISLFNGSTDTACVVIHVSRNVMRMHVRPRAADIRFLRLRTCMCKRFRTRMHVRS